MRLAATLMLVRDSQASPQVLMLRRSQSSAFAPNAYVFPGGTVDDVDRANGDMWSEARIRAEFRAEIDDALASSETPITFDEARALVAACMREVHEEAQITIDADALHLFSHWITPPTESRRYNTHFFVSRAPRGQEGIADRVETHEARWFAPDEALQCFADGSIHLVYPTIKHLERLRAFTSVDELLQYTAAKPIVTIMPDRAPSEGFVMPDTLEQRW